MTNPSGKPSSISFTVIGVAACGAVGLVSSAPAFAVPTVDCGSSQSGASIRTIGSFCEAVFDTAGEHSFTLPEGSTLADAIIIGGGGGATEVSANNNGYGGGGGEVTFIDLVDAGAPITVIVGEGGDGANQVGGNGGDTSFGDVTANGGFGGEAGGASGANGRGVHSGDFFIGNGSIDDGEGAGYLPSDPELVGSSPLFPFIENELELGRGGRYETTPAEIGFGWGGSSWANTAQPGSDGAVIIRWQPATLASTGVNLVPWALGALFLSAAGTAVALSSRSRRTQ